MKYIVGRYYRAKRVEYQAGQVIEIDDPEYAAWLGRDMGGFLTPVVEHAPQAQPEPVPAVADVRAPVAPPQDRMVRKAKRRSR